MVGLDIDLPQKSFLSTDKSILNIICRKSEREYVNLEQNLQSCQETFDEMYVLALCELSSQRHLPQLIPQV